MTDDPSLLSLLLSGGVVAAARRQGSRTARVIQRLDAATLRRWQARQPCTRELFSRKAR